MKRKRKEEGQPLLFNSTFIFAQERKKRKKEKSSICHFFSKANAPAFDDTNTKLTYR